MSLAAGSKTFRNNSIDAVPVKLWLNNLLVAFTPGGPSDVLSRILGRKMEQLLGQPFVIENRPGAGGNIAAEQTAKAAPDGYTLLMGNNSILATNAALYKTIGFDPEKDFAPISLIGSQANILVVNPKVK